jgi:hypothetical protein
MLHTFEETKNRTCALLWLRAWPRPSCRGFSTALPTYQPHAAKARSPRKWRSLKRSQFLTLRQQNMRVGLVDLIHLRVSCRITKEVFPVSVNTSRINNEQEICRSA